jgi:integrase
MPGIYIFKRKRNGQPEKVYTAKIRFGSEHGGATYLRSTGVTDRREAESIARRIAREIEDKDLPRRGQEILTIADMFSRWIDERGRELRSGKDIKWQIEMLLRLLGGAKIVRELGNREVSGFVQDAKAEKQGAVVINRCLGRLRATMNYAAIHWEEPVKVINWKAMMQREPKEREAYLTPDEARRLFEALPEHIALAFAFSLYTGVRLNELETLVWDRVDWDRGVAIVITKAQGMDPTTRNAWLSAKAIAILQMLNAKLPQQTAPRDVGSLEVFDLTNRRKHWEAARKAIAREDLHWHDIRAATATWSRQYAGKDLRLIGKALGHTGGTEVTARYARVVDGEVVDMLDQIPDITPQISQRILVSKLVSNQ